MLVPHCTRKLGVPKTVKNDQQILYEFTKLIQEVILYAVMEVGSQLFRLSWCLGFQEVERSSTNWKIGGSIPGSTCQCVLGQDT